MAGTYVYIDGSELQELCDKMAAKLTEAQFDKLMRRTLNEVGKRSKKIIREAIQSQYYASTSWVNSSIRSARVEGGGGSVLCRIPIISEKGGIGSQFAASGGAYGWNPPPYRITAQIVKGGTSVLPEELSHQGGQPPFRNIGIRTTSKKNPNRKLKKPVVEKNSKGGSLVFTRAGKSRLPIQKVSGIAVPQMPLNRSRDTTETRILDLAEKRLEHNFSHLFG